MAIHTHTQVGLARGAAIVRNDDSGKDFNFAAMLLGAATAALYNSGEDSVSLLEHVEPRVRDLAHDLAKAHARRCGCYDNLGASDWDSYAAHFERQADLALNYVAWPEGEGAAHLLVELAAYRLAQASSYLLSDGKREQDACTDGYGPLPHDCGHAALTEWREAERRRNRS